MSSLSRKIEKHLATRARRLRVRTLAFDPLDSRYERLYGVLINAIPGVGNQNRAEQKAHGRLLDKLEEIGQVKQMPDPRTGILRDPTPDERAFYITVSGGTVIVDEEEYRLAVARATANIPLIDPALSRPLERMMTWLESLPEQSLADVTKATAASEPAPAAEPAS